MISGEAFLGLAGIVWAVIVFGSEFSSSLRFRTRLICGTVAFAVVLAVWFGFLAIFGAAPGRLVPR